MMETKPYEKETATELEYLEFFFKRVIPALGPADNDVVASINEEFKRRTGKELPKAYKR